MKIYICKDIDGTLSVWSGTHGKPVLIDGVWHARDQIQCKCIANGHVEIRETFHRSFGKHVKNGHCVKSVIEPKRIKRHHVISELDIKNPIWL